MRIPIAILCLASVSSAQACSVCIAHMLGATLHGIGAQVLPKGEVVFGVSHLTFNKSNAGEEEGSREFETYHETTLGVAYGLTDRIMLSASLPSVTKTINSDEGRQSASGIGDASFGLTYQFKPTDSNPVLSSVGIAIKLPTGENSKRDEEGNLMEEHLQPGSGSTDLSLGYSFTLETGSFGSGLLYGGIQARFNGKNSRDYQYGNALFYNLGYSHPVSRALKANLELVGRYAGKDRVGDGTLDENSGGHLLYLGMGLTAQVNKTISVGLGVQVPVMQHLFGDQTEKGLFTFGIAGRF